MSDPRKAGEQLQYVAAEAAKLKELAKRASTSPDELSAKEWNSLDKQFKLESARQDMQGRRIYGFIFCAMCCIWEFAILAILVLQGCGSIGGWRAFHLNEKVLITALISTTANIWGLIVIVAKYFFYLPPAKRR
jgi:hypothetical protein